MPVEWHVLYSDTIFTEVFDMLISSFLSSINIINDENENLLIYEYDNDYCIQEG